MTFTPTRLARACVMLLGSSALVLACTAPLDEMPGQGEADPAGETRPEGLPGVGPVPVDERVGTSESLVKSSCALNEAIQARYDELGGKEGVLGRCVAKDIPIACMNMPFNIFERGSLAVGADGRVYMTMGSIDRIWQSLKSVCGPLGRPTSDETPSACAKGVSNRFVSGVIFAAGRSDDPATPTFDLQGELAARWSELGAECGSLGLPTRSTFVPECGKGRASDFEAGSISWSEATGAKVTGGDIRRKWFEKGRECGELGFPTSDEGGNACGGRYSLFENGSILWSPATGSHVTKGAIRVAHGQLGWECGALGHPTTDEVPNATGVRQDFQNGYATWHQASGRVDAVVHRSPSLSVSGLGWHISPTFGGTYPRALTLANGEFLATFESGAPGRLILRTSVSNDGGLSWSDRGVIADEPNTNRRSLANPHMAQLPSGRVLAAFRHHDQVGANYVYRIIVSGSDDNGRTFFYLSTPEAGTANPTWEPFLFQAPDGSVQVYYAREKANGMQDIVMRKSFDGGATWGGLITVATMGGSRDGMPGVARLQDGSLIVIFESWRVSGTPKFVIRTVSSTDSGTTWGRRRDVYVPVNAGKNAGAPDIRALPDGRLVAVFMTDEDSGPTDWPNHAAIKLLITEGPATVDNVRWRYPAAVATAAPAWWSGLTVGPTGEPFVLFDQAGPRIARIVPR